MSNIKLKIDQLTGDDIHEGAEALVHEPMLGECVESECISAEKETDGDGTKSSLGTMEVCKCSYWVCSIVP